MTSCPFWLMIVSTAMAVLPVLRSPMISSRWPRPIGVMASMALMPVCSGWLTGCRSAMPGRSIRRGRVSVGDDRPLAVERLAQRVDHPADQGVADRHRSRAPVARDLVAFVDLEVVAQDDDADGVLFEVEAPCRLTPFCELDHLAGHDAGQAVDAGDAVADLEHLAHLAARRLGAELLNLTSG